MADYIYPSLSKGLARNTIDLTGKLKVLLVTSKYQPSAKHKNRDDVTNEVKGPGYTSGGILVTDNKLVDEGEDTALKASPAIWEKATVTAKGAVVYYSSGGGAKYDELICYCDFQEEGSSTNGPFKLSWDNNTILVLGQDTSSEG